MKKLLIIFVILNVYYNTYSQCDTITYLFTDSVEVTINEWIKKIENNLDTTKLDFCIFLEKTDEEDIYKALVSFQISELTYKSNRMALINENYYPIIMDTDIYFVVYNSDYYEYGNRDGSIARSNFGLIGFQIVFNWRNGEVISVCYY